MRNLKDRIECEQDNQTNDEVGSQSDEGNIPCEGEIHIQNDAEVDSQSDDTTPFHARAQPSEGEVDSIQSDANVKAVNVVHS